MLPTGSRTGRGPWGGQTALFIRERLAATVFAECRVLCELAVQDFEGAGLASGKDGRFRNSFEISEPRSTDRLLIISRRDCWGDRARHGDNVSRPLVLHLGHLVGLSGGKVEPGTKRLGLAKLSEVPGTGGPDAALGDAELVTDLRVRSRGVACQQ